MNGNALEAILNVVIGMVFMWLIISVATMTLQEWIASYLRWRAKDLESAVRRLLGNDQVWAEHLYYHPLLQGLSKKMGVRPSYIPANKFALALFDIVMTAGTEQSYIQQQLLSAKRELETAPTQFLPFTAYLFRRFGNSISGIFHHLRYFFGASIGTGEQKFEELFRLTQKLFAGSNPADLGDLENKLREFFLKVISNKTTLVTGKEVVVSSVGFMKDYPAFRGTVLNLLSMVLEHQPALKQRWAEILVHNDKRLIARAQKELAPEQTLRAKLHQMVLEKAEHLDLNQENLELVFESIRQTIDTIDFIPVVNYIQGKLGANQGLDALQTLNPPLYESLSQLKNDLLGIANSPKIVEEAHARFVVVAATLNAEEQKLATMRLNTETWFNESMDRLSGWYKRKVTLLAFIIGLILAATLNVDSIGLVNHLWKEPTVREALAANATEFANANSTLPTVSNGDNRFDDAVDYFNEQFEGLELPLGWMYESVTLEQDQTCQYIPFGRNIVWGFKDNNATEENRCMRISNAPANSAEWNLKILGVLITAFAAAQGSPFWFDILKKVVNIRGVGKSPEEKPK